MSERLLADLEERLVRGEDVTHLLELSDRLTAEAREQRGASSSLQAHGDQVWSALSRRVTNDTTYSEIFS